MAGKALTVSTAAAGPVSVRQDRKTGESVGRNEPPLAPETGRSLSTADNQRFPQNNSPGYKGGWHTNNAPFIGRFSAAIVKIAMKHPKSLDISKLVCGLNCLQDIFQKSHKQDY